jgi:hypothetical protein
LLDGAVADQIGQHGVAVAARDPVDGGNDPRQPAFGENSDCDGAEERYDEGRKHAGLQACRHRKADNEGRHRNPQGGTRH